MSFIFLPSFIIPIIAILFVVSLLGFVYRLGIDRFYRFLTVVFYPINILLTSLVIAGLGQKFLATYFVVVKTYQGYFFLGLFLLSVIIGGWIRYQSSKKKLHNQGKIALFVALISNQAGEYLLIQSDDGIVSLLGGEIDHSDDEETLLQYIDSSLYDQAGINCQHTGMLTQKPQIKNGVRIVSFSGVDDTDAYCPEGTLLKASKKKLVSYAKKYGFEEYTPIDQLQ